MVQSSEILLEDLRERVTVDGLTPSAIERLHHMMISAATRLPVLDGLFLYDERGNWVVNSRAGEPDHSLNNSDRGYFEYHRTHTDLGVHIDQPVRSRSGGAWILPISVRFDKPDGSFGGVILATVSIDFLQRFYQTFEPGAGGSITLLSEQGILIARNPADEKVIGTDVSARPVFKGIAPGAPTSTYEYRSSVDNIVRIGSMQRVLEYPLMMLVSHSSVEVLADWWSSAMRYFTIGCIATASMIFLGFRMAEQVRVRADAERRYRLLAEYSSDAILCATMSGDRIYVSPSFSILTGWSNEESLNIRWSEMVHPEDRTHVADALNALKNGAELVNSTFRYIRKDGAFLWVEARLQIIPGINPSDRQFIANLRDITKRKAAEDAIVVLNGVLAAQANTDGLTGLANRRRFDEALSSEWFRSSRTGSPISLLMIDVDRFKLYNDRYGHQQGDACLKAISAAIEQAVRRPGDLVARYGGEEIVVLLPETDEAGAGEVAENVRRSIEQAALDHLENPPWSFVTASIGVATHRSHSAEGMASTDLLSRADEALYRAKRGGRNRVVCAEIQEKPAGRWA